MPNIYFPIIISEKPLSLGCQIEGHVGSKLQWIIPERIYQTNIHWKYIEPIEGQYTWDYYDTDMEILMPYHTTIGIKGVPVWARLWPEYSASPPKESCFSKLAKFIDMVIQRYHPNSVELFNEPDVDRDEAKWAEEYFGAWCMNKDWYAGGEYYGSCIGSVYNDVHALHPGVRIIAGALVGAEPSSLIFLQGAKSAGLKCDSLSFHKYIRMGGNFNAAFDFAHLLAQHTPEPLILSETSIMAKEDSEELQGTQASYLRYLRDNQQCSAIDVIQWYSLANNEWEHTDLVRDNAPTKAYDVFLEEQ
jgi:hypothetical protein